MNEQLNAAQGQRTLRARQGLEQQNAAQGQRTLRARQGLEQQNAAQGQRTLRARQGLEQQNAQGQRTLRSRQGLEQQNAQGQRTLRARQGLEERNTAQGQRGIRGLQGNAAGQRMQASSGTNVRLSDQQRARIRQTIIESNRAPRVGHVNFGVNVGTVIPRRAFTTIRVVPVPEYLTRIEPRWHGYEYFVYADRMVIVNPRTLRIVAVIPV